jgi:hypothetical protein
MTSQTSQTDTNLQTELDRLTYSAYLLTLDPGKAFSAVERVASNSWSDIAPGNVVNRLVSLVVESLESLRKCE